MTDIRGAITGQSRDLIVVAMDDRTLDYPLCRFSRIHGFRKSLYANTSMGILLNP